MPSRRLPTCAFKSRSHGVRGFADGDHKNAIVGVKVVEILANAQDSSVAVDMPSERAFDGSVPKRGGKNVASDDAHACELLLAVGRDFRHLLDNL